MPTSFISSSARLRAARWPMSLWIRSGSAIWRPIVMTGFRNEIGSWKTIAISLPRTFSRSVSVSFS